MAKSLEDLMNEHFETVSYDDEGDWKNTPETGDDPDDEEIEKGSVTKEVEP